MGAGRHGKVRAMTDTAPSSAPTRSDLCPLISGWRFAPAGDGDSRSGTGRDVDDSGWEEVCLPHCVTDLSWRDWDPEDWAGRWIYRRRFDLPSGWTGQRVFVDVDGAMVGATVFLNDVEIGHHLGGYLPFAFELTAHLRDRDNLLAIMVDSRWSQVPPQGSPDGPKSIDYLEPGGLYRHVTLRAVPTTYLGDVFARPQDVLDPARRHVAIQVGAEHGGTAAADATLDVELSRNGATVATARASATLTPGTNSLTARLGGLADVALWHPDDPALYDVTTRLRVDGQSAHQHRTRIGFREARFEDGGFFLNGQRHQIRGLNRHQIYPYVGMAMPDRVQRRDARILKDEFAATMVRCAHYPQSPAFFDACDELGIMVWEEVPGWQYVDPDPAWQDLLVRDTRDMVVRDRNHPSIVVWGVHVNESKPDPQLYARTRAAAYELDGSRPTSGSMTTQSREDWDQDVFTFDDYSHTEEDAFLKPPVEGLPYLIGESVGALSGPHLYRHIDPDEVLEQQALLHGRVHDIAASDPGYAGLLGWLAFDYGSLHGWTWRHIKTPGIADGFRIPKPGAAFYTAQIDPARRAVLIPSVIPAAGEWPARPIVVWGNCERVEAYVDGTSLGSVEPDGEGFPHLAHPPFRIDLSGTSGTELRLEGYAGSQRVSSRTMTVDPAGDRLSVAADDGELAADGADATRVVFRAVDRHGWPRRGVTGDVRIAVEGPGALVGDDPFAFEDNGGAGAVWIRTRPGAPGTIRVAVAHRALGTSSTEVTASSD